MKHISKLHALLLAGALSTAAIPAIAQESGDYGPARYQSTTEEITVTGPRYHQKRGEYGQPEKNIALSRAVRFDDLDLRTGRGAYMLRERVKMTARTLCRQIDTQYIVDDTQGDHCYRDAVEDALYHADRAIADARYND
jgi:UrcA family protein